MVCFDAECLSQWVSEVPPGVSSEGTSNPRTWQACELLCTAASGGRAVCRSLCCWPANDGAPGSSPIRKGCVQCRLRGVLISCAQLCIGGPPDVTALCLSAAGGSGSPGNETSFSSICRYTQAGARPRLETVTRRCTFRTHYRCLCLVPLSCGVRYGGAFFVPATIPVVLSDGDFLWFCVHR